MSHSKILILHDTFLYKGGGERLVLMMAQALGADIASGFFSPGSYDPKVQGFQGKAITLMPRFFLHEFTWLPKKLAFIAKNGLRHFGLKWSFATRTKALAQDYDTVILSGDCLSALWHFRGKKILYYCHTIPRYLFDQKEEYEKKVPKFMLFVYQFMTNIFKKAYLRDLAEIDILLTNSKNTQERIKHFTQRDASILYPPVDTNFFTPEESASAVQNVSYFLSFARLSGIKRVDRIVRAFQALPDKNLIITFGKNDPERKNITDMIQGYPNISMRESPTDIELRDLIRHAEATIYIPVDEDFGMSPLESMSCGVPVIGVNDGGLKETIIPGKTGVLIPKNCTPEDLIDTIVSYKKSDYQPSDCRMRAEDFGLENFRDEILQWCK